MGSDDLGRYKLFPGGSFGVWLRKKAVEEFHRFSTITFARPPETPTSPDRFGSAERHTRRIEPDVDTSELFPK